MGVDQMNIRFKWVGGATWILKVGDVTIACDPVLCPKGSVQDYTYFKTVRVDEPVFSDGDFDSIDLWLLTHGHEDHLDAPGIAMIGDDACIVTHKSNKGTLKKRNIPDYTILSWDQEYEKSIRGTRVLIRAVPAVHSKFSWLGKYIGNNNGYLITLFTGGSAVTIYATGDDVFSSKRFAKHCGKPVDIVIANAGGARVGSGLMGKIIGRITNNSVDIEKMASVLHPAKLIPVHHGTFTHYMDKKIPFDKNERILSVKPGEWANITI